MSDQGQPLQPYSPTSGDAALEQTGANPLKSSDPARLGPYVPLGLLGSGGMGRVYLARPADDTPGLAAVKVIRPEYAEDARFRRRFEREAAVHERVRTRYAPSLLGTGFEDEPELLWMATQYLPGLNLADAVQECGTLTPAGAWRLVGELGHALTALAAAGVVHRDLKPSNVLLSAHGVHVIDFGISQAVDSSAITSTGNRVGTPAYMSPEYLRDGRCDSASDVFSLAGTLVYAVTGRAPFGDGTGVDVMHRVAFEEPKPEVMTELLALDMDLSAILTACLDKDPAGRPTPGQLVEAATAAARRLGPGLPWPDPLDSRLRARREAAELLSRATVRETVHLRAPVRREGGGAVAGAGSAAEAAPGSGSVSDSGSVSGSVSLPGSGSVPTPAPAPAAGFGPPPEMPGQGQGAGRGPGPVREQGPGQAPNRRRRRKQPYLMVVAALAVCVLAVTAWFASRPAVGDSTRSGTAAEGTASDSTGVSAVPAASDSPSSATEKASGRANGTVDEEEEEEGDEEDGEGSELAEDRSAGQGDATPDPTNDTPDSDAEGDGGTAPSAAPTQTATKSSTPAWISDCTYYSGSELTKRGDTGDRVLQVQCMLIKRGYSVGGSGVDGNFGKDTRASVRLFQSDKGLTANGKVNAATWAALRSST